ncbi:Pyridine nucleotide-disulfide oxidoreductase [Alteracholeplasma palmae J233]|uniref:Ferredoxin--NADP reductase n=1 Tax=Alteracholeplasma palmae (strain ATCC 49389 / J233) TaxID=1318466 RepID=U4KL88_ALTPJ|nr:NAD(P)/FAD-dependent oxidoreductase [Alteracholeplasma palmae]CCV64664.1 Pyridine nucleotide-disulfide oxidoreductase [Alteracholeplasma palmae J233]
MLELLIIGAGPTGLYAAFLAGLRKLDAAVIESLPYMGGQPINLYKDKPIYDAPGFYKIKAEDYVKECIKQYKRFEKEVPVYLNQEALEVKRVNDYYEVTTNQQVFQTKTILIAHGGGSFTPMPLDVENSHLEGVIYHIDNLEDHKDKEIVVLGGGDSAVDWALELKSITENVHLVHRRDAFRAHQDTLDQYLKLNGKTHTPYVVKRVLGDKKVTGIELEDVKTKELLIMPAHTILVNYGLLGSKSKLEDWGIEGIKGLIYVNSKMETNLEGIYAAGNGVFYEGKAKMIVTGMGEAATAIGVISEYLHPERTTNTQHSSSIITE